MAQAVVEMFPEAKLAIGPTIEDGFYYDFGLPRPLADDDLRHIEQRMAEIVAGNFPVRQSHRSKAEAIDYFKQRQQPFKVEIAEGINEPQLSFFTQDSFTDLCGGPHAERTGQVAAFKLLKVSGAYWRGNEKNPMLQRIYGTAFASARELDEHLQRLEESEKRDHRKLGVELDLFHINDDTGPGLVFYHPKGAALRRTLENYMYAHQIRRGFQPVMSPHIARERLYEMSGHTEYYKEHMFFTEADGQPYVLKPMNCPGHIMIYKTKRHSYRELPLRYFEFGTVYRFERSGVMHGLLRVRGFTQDDGHIFCTLEQLAGEILSNLQAVDELMRLFGFSYSIYLSTRPEKFVGQIENWNTAEAALAEALKQAGMPYQIDEGEGVFYGPKIDVKLKDALGRVWQGPTIQVDFNLPERFKLEFVGPDSKMHTPVMVHRAIFGSFERFIGALIEHYGGAFPFWLAPVQAALLPMNDGLLEYARSLAGELTGQGFRVEIDESAEKLGAKIRQATLQKIPYMLVLGKREKEQQGVSLRHLKNGDLGFKSLADVFQVFSQENVPKAA
jgi:threonyl-tRNA synthetase